MHEPAGRESLERGDEQTGQVLRIEAGPATGSGERGGDDVRQALGQPVLVDGESLGDVGMPGGVQGELHGHRIPLALLPGTPGDTVVELEDRVDAAAVTGRRAARRGRLRFTGGECLGAGNGSGPEPVVRAPKPA
ncbi:hypothetical protein GCM10023336_36080 [Streptomyces similanensis]|uniref:Uncharacterized protein n=1 Tax=Streptomyces similanensis TaxID=1274988 RepID=A0ABP9KJ67_9ACTN